MKVSILGAGSWGTALAIVCRQNGHSTSLWARRPDLVASIIRDRRNTRYLASVELPQGIEVTADIGQAVAGAHMVLFVVPSSGLRETAKLAQPFVQSGTLLGHAVKGFDPVTRQRMSEVLLDVFAGSEGKIGVLSGPSHAEEVASGLPTTVVVAGYKRSAAEQFQDAFMNRFFRVYTNPDVIGAELGGALKNIIALGVGVADGLGFGDNAKAAIMTRGLAEIARLGTEMGASPLTFAGLSGVGDLIVTCTSLHSRNFRTGRLLGQGFRLDEALQQVGMAVEGVGATQAAILLAQEHGIEMPISEALNAILFHGKPPAEAVADLMGRERGREMEEVAKTLVYPDWE